MLVAVHQLVPAALDEAGPGHEQQVLLAVVLVGDGVVGGHAPVADELLGLGLVPQVELEEGVAPAVLGREEQGLAAGRVLEAVGHQVPLLADDGLEDVKGRARPDLAQVQARVGGAAERRLEEGHRGAVGGEAHVGAGAGERLALQGHLRGLEGGGVAERLDGHVVDVGALELDRVPGPEDLGDEDEAPGAQVEAVLGVAGLVHIVGRLEVRVAQGVVQRAELPLVIPVQPRVEDGVLLRRPVRVPLADVQVVVDAGRAGRLGRGLVVVEAAMRVGEGDHGEGDLAVLERLELEGLGRGRDDAGENRLRPLLDVGPEGLDDPHLGKAHLG